jgi:hypothetical protein
MDIVFLVRHHNDFDHALPIMDYLITKKKQKIIVYGVGEGYKNCKRHISFLKNVLSTKIIPFEEKYYSNLNRIVASIIDKRKLKNKKTSDNFLVRVVGANINRILFYFLSGSAKRLVRSLSVDSVILADFGTEGLFPYKNIIKSAKKYEIKVIAYLHGWYVFRNKNPIRLEKIRLNKAKEFINKFIFGIGHNILHYDTYMVGPETNDTYFKSVLYKQSPSPSIVMELGVPRFSYEWMERFVNNWMRKEQLQSNDDNIKVVVFISNEKFNVNKIELIDTLKELSKNKRTTLLISPHTRSGLSGLSKDDLFISRHISKLDSTELIKWADIGIVYGTSIGLQMMVENVTVVVPTYIDHNITMYKDYDACVSINSVRGLIKYIDRYPDRRDQPNPDDIKLFINNIIYGGHLNYEDMMNKFTFFVK